MASRSQRFVVLAFVLLLFFASGFSALVFQTIWQRLLGFFSGVDVYSVTITVAAFMGGLGCGSIAGGSLADRLSAKHRLLVFGLAEGIIAVFALISKWLYYDLLYVRWSGLASSVVVLPVVLFVSLLIPTFCMGVTLPILARTFTTRIETAPSVVGYLYGVNTLGAAAGALATPWILLRLFAFPDILKIAAGLNAFCAVGAGLVWWTMERNRAAVAETMVAPDISESTNRTYFSFRTWMLIYALSGFVALGFEIVWFRLLGVLQKSTAFTFPTLLAIYLGGFAAGVIIGIPIARRVRKPAITFLILQSGIPLYAAMALELFLDQVNRRAFLEPVWTYLGSYEPVNAADMLSAIAGWIAGRQIEPALSQSARFGFVLYLVLPAILIVPSTLLMGMSFPLLQKVVQTNPLFVGRRVGWLQTCNIAGSMCGALLVGWCFLGWLGTAGTLRLLVLLGAIFLALAAWLTTDRRWKRAAALAGSVIVVAWLAFLISPAKRLWAKMHGAAPDTIIVREDGSGVAVLKGDPNEFPNKAISVFSNGIGQSQLPYGTIHTQIGLLAVALHPKPVEVAVIGLGSGDTVYALGGSPHTHQITCIEIVNRMQTALSDLAPRLHYPALDGLLKDPRIEWKFTDGRAYISRSRKRFDVIEADALRPNSAYAGNLYSVEYFQTLKAHLNPDGLAVTWVPTDRILASFLEVFPHAIAVNSILIGSQQPIDADPARVLERLADPFTTKYYERIGQDLRPLVETLISGQFMRFSPQSNKPGKRDLDSDLFPKDEYMVPSRL